MYGTLDSILLGILYIDEQYRICKVIYFCVIVCLTATYLDYFELKKVNLFQFFIYFQ